MDFSQLELFDDSLTSDTGGAAVSAGSDGLHAELRDFREFDKETVVLEFPDPAHRVPVYINEFWTAKQRAANAIHEISYRACFKPQLPAFFIDRLTRAGDTVYDPFMGRGTTLVEAGLRGRVPMGCDINPVSSILIRPRLDPPPIEKIAARLEALELESPVETREDLLVFYHPDTLREMTNLRAGFLAKQRAGELDRIDAWIRMVATNRLTGHSPGFFSVYTLPPNQATSVKAQIRINERRNQVPPKRDIAAIILKKSRSLLKGIDSVLAGRLRGISTDARLITASCDATPGIADNSVHLVVTSPPFLDVVNYKIDNWLRCWFNGFDAEQIEIWQLKKPPVWQAKMTEVFRELHRILVPGGHIAFEVGEVRGGKILMEELVVPAATDAGLDPVLVLVNDQQFTKTANCWGVDNQSKGTNTNRVVLLRKSG